MSLSEYHRKRRFDETSEPKGKPHKTAKKLEFVVQKHNASRVHYDFRLELDGVLKSWAVPKGPSLNPEDKRLAMMVEDHPYDYRTFEGWIPEGNYGAGQVIVWDNGTYEPLHETSDPQKELRAGLKKGHLTFIMHGKKLKGEFALIKSPHMGENAWLLVKKGDKFASEKDVTKQTGSVISHGKLDMDETGPDLKDAPKTKLPKAVKPMLATLVDEAFDSDDWVYEIKWDGYRAIGSWDGKSTQLYSRNGNDFTKKYPPIEAALRKLSKPAVIDGEIVMLDKNGVSRFELLQNYAQSAAGHLTYQVFDVIWYDGHDVTGWPLLERKKLLKKLIGNNDLIRYSDHIEKQGKKFFAMAEKENLEGIMAKQRDSLYKTGFRSKQWLKIKTHKRQEVVIGGFTEPRGSRKHIGALVVGIYDGDELKYVGHTGGGIPTEMLKPLREKLEKLERQESPFANKFKPNAPVHWVQPKLVCEVKFGEWTKEGYMRQPIFIGMRTDKPAHEVKREVPMPKPDNAKKTSDKLKFTHLDKVFWPERGYTKGDLIEYYKTVSDTMLPYIINRPHNLLRHPNGYKGDSFFQKDMGDKMPDFIKTVAVYSESNEKNLNYYVCDGLDSLLYMVQLGSIEINPWSSQLQHLDKPDWGVIDLDPEGIGFDKVVEVADVVHDVCEELKIPCYPKTSGKTGIHIFIPMGAKYTYEQVRQFCQLLANLVHERTEKITSVVRDPKQRQHKIYIDYLQNRESQTLASAYSVRPTKEASVSTPLHWDEVKKGLDPAKFTIKNTPARIKKVGDLWKPVLGKPVDIARILKQLETK